MRHLLCQGHCLVAPRQPLVRIAKIPHRKGAIAVASHARVLAIEERRGAVLLGIIEYYTLRKMCLCSGYRTQVEQRRSQGTMRRQKHCRVLGLLREGEELLAECVCHRKFGACMIII